MNKKLIYLGLSVALAVAVGACSFRVSSTPTENTDTTLRQVEQIGMAGPGTGIYQFWQGPDILCTVTAPTWDIRAGSGISCVHVNLGKEK